jgi:hypothetical protein
MRRDGEAIGAAEQVPPTLADASPIMNGLQEFVASIPEFAVTDAPRDLVNPAAVHHFRLDKNLCTRTMT